MTYRTILRAAMMLGLTMTATACQEASTAPTADLKTQTMASPEVEVALESEATTATARGDTEGADALRDVIQAIRAGIRPSQIEVKIHNETFTYSALVVGRVYQLASGRALVRTLVAWGGTRPPSVLHVIQKTDKALFGRDPGGNGNVGAARGRWANGATGELWMATAGSSEIELTRTGPSCPSTTAAELALRCTLSRWDLRINGKFELLPDRTDQVEIHTNASDVIGVILSPSR